VKGVILAAGKGTRMLPLTERRPKPLVPVLDRPMLEHIVTGARDAGVDHFALIVGHLGDMIREYFGDGSRLGVRITYLVQEEMKGTGAAALLAEEFIGGEPFFMSWGDIIVPPRNYKKVISAFEPGKTDAVLSLNWVEDPYEGAAVYVQDGFVERIEEKPPKGTATTHFNNAGLFVYTADILDRVKTLKPSKRGEIELPEAVQQMVQEGKRIRAVELEGYWSDVARPSAVLALNEMIMQDRYGDARGVYFAPSAKISDDSIFRPPVYVGEGCEVREAKLGPNVVLMDGCRVEPGAEIKDIAVFTGGQVSKGAKVHDCVVEEGALVPEGVKIAGERAFPKIVCADGTIQEVPR
jgi:NDP-sugar pyrophosphorylase family protein